MSTPLDGIKVVELGQMITGPLAELGIGGNEIAPARGRGRLGWAREGFI